MNIYLSRMGRLMEAHYIPSTKPKHQKRQLFVDAVEFKQANLRDISS